MKGRVHSVETLGARDGPGLRYVVFLQGCPMRCLYCHNPDTWNYKQGKLVDAEHLVTKATNYKPYFGKTGGITLSGGEPFLQPKFCTEILRKCKQESIHTAMDTSGYLLNDDVKQALNYTNLVILDIKHADPVKYKQLTGQEQTSCLTFLDYVANIKIPLWIRQVIVPGWNDTIEDMMHLKNLLTGISCLEKVELLPYHTMGIDKWKQADIPYPLAGVKEPSDPLMTTLQNVFADLNQS